MNWQTKTAAIKAALEHDQHATLKIITDRLSEDDIDYLTSRVLV